MRQEEETSSSAVDSTSIIENKLVKATSISDDFLQDIWMGNTNLWFSLDSGKVECNKYPFFEGYILRKDTIEFVHNYKGHEIYSVDSLGIDVELKGEYLPNSLFLIQVDSSDKISLLPLNYSAAYLSYKNGKRNSFTSFIADDFIPLLSEIDSVASQENIDSIVDAEIVNQPDSLDINYLKVDRLHLRSPQIVSLHLAGLKPEIVPLELYRRSSIYDTLKFDSIHFSLLTSTFYKDIYYDLILKQKGSFIFAKGTNKEVIFLRGSISHSEIDSLNLLFFQSGFFRGIYPERGWIDHGTEVRIKVFGGGREKEMTGQLSLFPISVQAFLKQLMKIKCESGCKDVSDSLVFPLTYRR